MKRDPAETAGSVSRIIERVLFLERRVPNGVPWPKLT
jgi:hypothetical protein